MILGDILIAVFDCYIYLSFFGCVLKRKHKLYCLIPAFASFVICMCLLRILGATPPIFMSFNILSLAVFSFFYHASSMRKILYACLIIALNMGTEIICGYILIRVYHLPIEKIRADSDMFLIGGVIAKLLFFLLTRLVSRLHRRHTNSLPLIQWMIVIPIPLFGIIAAHGLAIYAAGSICFVPEAAFYISGGIIMINIMVFILYDTLSEQSLQLIAHEKERSRFELEKQQYEAAIRQGREMGSIIHEAHRHLRIFSSLLENGDIDATKEYIRKLDKNAFKSIYIPILPNYPAINVILCKKIVEARLHGITISYDVAIPPGIPVEPVDICVVLGNALDNAIEACEKLKTERKIEVMIRFSKNRLIMIIINSSEPVKIIDGMCETTKENKRSHGYGFSNMQHIISKYRGNMIPQYDKGLFSLHIMMQI